jgi:hypothetical protein
MFWRKIDPQERNKVMDLLFRWHTVITRVDEATDKMKQTIAEQPLGIKSIEFERVRLVAVSVVAQIRKETTSPPFWPILTDNQGAMRLIELQQKLDETLNHQLYLLRLSGATAEAFRNGNKDSAPSIQEISLANKAFENMLDDMGVAASHLARHYKISGQDYLGKIRE